MRNKDRHKGKKRKNKDIKEEFERIIKIRDKKEKQIKQRLNMEEQQVIEQIREERQEFRNNVKKTAVQFNKKTENHYERINAEQADMKRQIDYLKAAYKLLEEQEDELIF